MNEEDHLDTLNKFPPIFVRMVIFNLVKELGILYEMSEGMADHSVACYAQGYNKDGLKYTVLSCDSYFYAYNLDNGYVSFKDLMNSLKEPKNLSNETEVHVYYLENLLSCLKLSSYLTWLYFCVLLGDYDIGLDRNIGYFKQKRIDTRNGNFMNLIAYLRQNESSMLSNDFSEIRNSYRDRRLVEIIDDLLAFFKFENNSYKFIASVSIDDFERFIISIRDLKICYLSCYVEDCNEQSIYQICKDTPILGGIYSELSVSSVLEYSRLPITTSGTLIKSVDYKPSKIDNLALNLLVELNEKNLKKDDDLSLLYVSFAIWYDWLTRNKYNNETTNISADMFLDSIIYNWIILMSKSNNDNNIINQSGDLKKILDQKNLCQISDLYEEIINDGNKINSSAFFRTDLKLVHRLNEFQIAYYLLNVYNKLKKFSLKFLGPNEFLNCSFICKFIQESQLGNKKSFQLKKLLEENNLVQQVFGIFILFFLKYILINILLLIDKIKNEINNIIITIRRTNSVSVNELTDLVKKISINK
jgi:hypothetical protein